ncbi:hypothetical protein TRIATDRAFT_129098 [Trichoderma atroviride IMI 206040]|uniref:F-box domain-containing protein n=1 Tax=Hypocrea atroviridis (strain ATCC 20476 / IMI 206040) TaxID=452589 RepID=G9PBV7_HYPAI|nr:uncharacterized protein TRIATDRAFT_129098 [Trichoderma atroviride IMI 206040]EHK39851.1 hypothetical protein TRIATDRAFT_129098 [Trichoderma atroviride IMI 206040]
MRYSRLLHQLLGKGRWHYWRHDQKSAILQLPLDILLLITDNLALHDKFLLSHTCKALRQVLLQDWDIKLPQLSFEHQIAFWVGLAYTLPNRWVCLKCCKLHPINTSDVPAAFTLVRYNRTVPCLLEISRGIETSHYSIQHYHIQLALKLSRLGNIYQQYLGALMQTFTRTLCPHMRIIGGLMGSRSSKKSSINVIVHWCKIMSPREGSILLKEATLLEDGVELAYDSPGQWVFNSCLHCLTDFAVIISTDKRKAIIRAWHDFGIEGSPLDASWKAHVKAKDEQYWFDVVGLHLDYTHGSIRELWSEDVSHGTGTSHAKVRSVFTKLIDGWSKV